MISFIVRLPKMSKLAIKNNEIKVHVWTFLLKLYFLLTLDEKIPSTDCFVVNIDIITILGQALVGYLNVFAFLALHYMCFLLPFFSSLLLALPYVQKTRKTSIFGTNQSHVIISMVFNRCTRALVCWGPHRKAELL